MLAFGTILRPVHNKYREMLVSAPRMWVLRTGTSSAQSNSVHLMPLMAQTAAGEC